MGFLEKLAPYGRIMFSITMTSFGLSHFYYTETVRNMVPGMDTVSSLLDIFRRNRFDGRGHRHHPEISYSVDRKPFGNHDFFMVYMSAYSGCLVTSAFRQWQ